MSEPTCRACYAKTFTDDERARFYAEQLTTSIFWCDDHQRAMDAVIDSLPSVQLIRSSTATFLKETQ